jgi:mycofactocin glycosyltransferase
MPFLGTEAEAEAARARFASIDRRRGDELIIVDNCPAPTVHDDPAGGITVVRAPERRSAYHARNTGVAGAGNGWLLFVDADSVLPRSLLDLFFARPPAVGCGVVAGEVVGLAEQSAVLARWARSRRGQMASHHLEVGPLPAGIAGNLLVRREAWDGVGGFGDTPAADVELCWEVQRRGWGFEYRPEVVVEHRDPERAGQVLRQAKSYGAGVGWSRRVYGRSVPAARLARPVVRAIGGGLVWSIRGRGERALFKLFDGVWAVACWWGYVTSRWAGGRRRRLDE